MKPSKSWKRYSATILGIALVWSLAVFFSSKPAATAAIGAIAAMVLGFIGGDSASKFVKHDHQGGRP
ncbi:MAG: hypothetical protein KJ621_16470 [Proteobacteria bacterium]|nr:hypothetical protein [Pseudomonadota bacterium]